jgi:hypothetical protein
MAVFIVLSLAPNPTLDANIAKAYSAQNKLVLSPTACLVSDDEVTTAQVCEKIGVKIGGLSDVIVFKFQSYFGIASTAIWEWIKLRGVAP